MLLGTASHEKIREEKAAKLKVLFFFSKSNPVPVIIGRLNVLLQDFPSTSFPVQVYGESVKFPTELTPHDGDSRTPIFPPYRIDPRLETLMIDVSYMRGTTPTQAGRPPTSSREGGHRHHIRRQNRRGKKLVVVISYLAVPNVGQIVNIEF